MSNEENMSQELQDAVDAIKLTIAEDGESVVFSPAAFGAVMAAVMDPSDPSTVALESLRPAVKAAFIGFEHEIGGEPNEAENEELWNKAEEFVVISQALASVLNAGNIKIDRQRGEVKLGLNVSMNLLRGLYLMKSPERDIYERALKSLDAFMAEFERAIEALGDPEVKKNFELVKANATLTRSQWADKYPGVPWSAGGGDMSEFEA